MDLLHRCRRRVGRPQAGRRWQDAPGGALLPQAQFWRTLPCRVRSSLLTFRCHPPSRNCCVPHADLVPWDAVGPSVAAIYTPTAIPASMRRCWTPCRACASSATSAWGSITSTSRRPGRAASRSATRRASWTARPPTWPSACWLAAARRLPEGDRYARGPDFLRYDPSYMLGHEVHGTRLGLLGMGRIGEQVARRAAGFGMEVVYHNRTRKPDAEAKLATRYVAKDELLATSDHVVLTVPLTDETRGLIGAAELARMKPTATLVNVARGPRGGHRRPDRGAGVPAHLRGGAGRDRPRAAAARAIRCWRWTTWSSPRTWAARRKRRARRWPGARWRTCWPGWMASRCHSRRAEGGDLGADILPARIAGLTLIPHNCNIAPVLAPECRGPVARGGTGSSPPTP